MYKQQEHSRRFFLILGMLFLLTHGVFSQKTRVIKAITNAEITYAEKIVEIERLLSEREKSEGDSLHYLYNDYAYWLFSPKRDKAKALQYATKAYERCKSLAVTDTVFLQENTRDLAYYYQDSKQYRKALSIYKESVSLDSDSHEAIKMYGAMAFCAAKINDIYSGIEFLELKASLLKDRESTPKSLFKLYNNLTDLCRKTRRTEDYQQGQAYGAIADSLASLISKGYADSLKKYTDLLRVYSRSSKPQDLAKKEEYKSLNKRYQRGMMRFKSNVYNLKTNLAQLYNQHRYADIEKSRRNYMQALELAVELQDSSNISEVYYGLATLSERQNIDFEESIALYKKGLLFSATGDSISRYLNYHGLARVYARNSAYQKSLNARITALSWLTGLAFDRPEEILSKDLIRESRKTYLLPTLTDQAETYLKYYEESENQELLEKSVAYFDLADKVIDLLELNRTTLNSRFFWRQSSATLYSKAIKACFLMNDVDKAFYFSEKNKALLLMEDLAQERFKQSLNLPPSFIKKEQRLKEELVILKSSLSDINAIDPARKDSLSKQLVETRIALSTLVEEQYGSDALFAIKPGVTSLKEVKSQLATDEILLEYHVSFDEGFGIYTNDDSGYLISVTKDHSEIIKIPALTELRKMVRNTSDWFNRPYEVDDDVQLFAQSSHKLFLRLFPTANIQEMIKQRKVAIVADSFLSTLPFDALSVRGDTLRHLIYDSEISYLYSYSFQNQLAERNIHKLQMLAMAPGNFSDPSMTPLMNSKKELNHFKPDYLGQYFFDQTATKDNFLTEVQDADIIHLATHADVRESSSPWIAFADEKIFLEELYLIQNKASLVVLSGCNTAIGQEAIGEGLMSLARGFFYSGSETVISTLWSIDDNATTQIVNDFYANLNAGQRKSEALRNAKLTYLETHSLSEVSPHFWASFILLGRDDVLIESSDKNLNAWVVLLLAGFGLSAFTIFSIKKKVLFLSNTMTLTD